MIQSVAAGRALGGRFKLSVALALALAGCATTGNAPPGSTAKAAEARGVTVTRTADGIPHVRASDWTQLGVGVGYVQAQDNLCTLAEAFVTYRGERSRAFGADGRPQTDSTFGRPKNIDLDFFFRVMADDAAVARQREAQPAELRQLVDGYAQGYNRYLKATRSSGAADAPACLNAPWVHDIAPEDVYRRMVAALLAAGYSRFVTDIANAAPPAAAKTASAAPSQADAPTESLSALLSRRVGADPALGSNAVALGGHSNRAGQAVLLGNPHWFWAGPDRFYQMHLQIPGAINVAGVSFLGLPLVMIGFNDAVAWSHTVSTARRFGLFQLELAADDARAYVVDGQTQAMQARRITVDARDAQGRIQPVTRTLYATRYGPVINLARYDPALGWTGRTALAIRDVNAANTRAFRNFFLWNRARSLDEFIAVQRREAAMPWVNTLAIGKGDARAWYADIGAVPNAPDPLRQACATPLGQAFAKVDPYTPFLDGSRSACDWRNDPSAAQPQTLPAAALPALLREDYVANMNNSHWLANPAAPLVGYDSVLGGEQQPLTLRAREGLTLAAEWAASAPASGRELARRVAQDTLNAQAYSARLLRQPVLGRLCGPAQAGAETSTLTAQDLAAGCAVLAGWDGQAGAASRGALLWNQFWLALAKPGPQALYQQDFDVRDPVATPAGLALPRAALEAALGEAIAALRRQPLPLDAPAGALLHAGPAGESIALYGGCDAPGYFTILCGGGPLAGVSATASGNSYLQVVRFDDAGVHAATLLAHGQRETALAGGPGMEPIARYARRDWLAFPFTDPQIAAGAVERIRLDALPTTLGSH